MKKLLIRKILICSLGLVLLCFFTYKTYCFFQNHVKTEQAELVEYKEKIAAEAIIVRKEKKITKNNSGFIKYLVEDGEKVSKNQPIYEYYSSEDDLKLQNKIDEAENEKKILKKCSDSYNVLFKDLFQINERIKKNTTDLLICYKNNMFSKATEIKNSLVYNFCIREKLLDDNTNFSERINFLNNLIKELNEKKPLHTTVNTDEEGYFSSFVDGLEDCFNYDDIENLKTDDFFVENAKPIDNNDAIGKIIAGKKYYIICKLPLCKAENFIVKNFYSVELSSSEIYEITMELANLNKNEEKNECLLAFSCNYFDKNIVSARIEKINILLNTYSGIKIRNDAIRKIKGENDEFVEGVFVKKGNYISFKKTEIIFRNQEFSICKNYDESESHNNLKAYDHVIFKGRNLFDGKKI